MSEEKDWFGEEKTLNLEQMDELVTKMRAAREFYEDRKKASTEAYALYKDMEAEVMKILDAANKKSYKVDGLGTFTIVDKMSVPTPKTIDQKRKVFNWIEAGFGKDYLDSLLSINHNKLNSFYKEAYANSDNKAMFSIDGLDEPTTIKEGRFRSAK